MKLAWRRLFPFLSWPWLTSDLLRGEALAGLTVGLMVIPQGVAYAGLAGMPLVTGIYASMLPALIAGLFSASTRLSVGPTALTCLLVNASLTGLAEPGSGRWIEMAVLLSFLAGTLQIVLGFMRFGWLLNLVSAPVLMAFTQAAAVLIVASQLPTLLGMSKGGQGLSSIEALHAPSIIFGLVSLLILALVRRWRPAFPTVLLVVIVAAGISIVIGFAAGGGVVVGPLQKGLPTLSLPAFPDLSLLGKLAMPALAITLVSFLETASSAKVDNEREGRHWDQDQDLIGQGAGKIAAGFCGAFPTSASFSRSALNLYAGARTGWATIFSVGVVLLALLFLTPVLHHVPQAVLASIVLVAVLGLIKPEEFTRLWRISRVEALIAGVTFTITVLLAPQLYWGVLSGVMMALTHFLYQRLHPRIIEVGIHADGSLRDRHLWNLPPLAPLLYAFRMDAALDFAAASSFERAIEENLSIAPATKHVCLFAQPLNRIDATGVQAFTKIRAQLRARGIMLHISGMKLPVERILTDAGALLSDPFLKMYRTDHEALTALSRIEELPSDLAAAAI